jgi:hypothetical protein
MAEQAKEEWREATPDDSGEGSSSLGTSDDESTSYKSIQLTSRPVKKVHGEEELDAHYDQTTKSKEARK